MSSIRSLSLALALAPLAGCLPIFGCWVETPMPVEPLPYPDDTGGVACTDEARASVMVRVVDFEGAPAPDAVVSWRVPEGDMGGEAECMDEACSSQVAGWEVEGPIELSANLMQPSEEPGCYWFSSANARVEVPVSADGCHVETQSLTLTLGLPELVCEDDAETPPEQEPVETEPVHECDGGDCG